MSISTKYNGNPILDIETVYYTGSDSLLKGYALCYDQDATDDGTNTGLGNAVEKPATANLNAFAGIVQDAVTGPCYVRIAKPKKGAILDAFTDANMTAVTTVLGPQDGSYALAAKADSTFNLAAVALAMETVDTDTTNANKKVKFI